MVGNYGPSKDSYTWTCPEDEFPSGMVNRGVYTVNSALTGDGGNNIFQWEWGFEIKKDWE